MSLALEIASWICILLGSAFTLTGALGLVRMPDIFTRMHAASVTALSTQRPVITISAPADKAAAIGKAPR